MSTTSRRMCSFSFALHEPSPGALRRRRSLQRYSIRKLSSRCRQLSVLLQSIGAYDRYPNRHQRYVRKDCASDHGRSNYAPVRVTPKLYPGNSLIHIRLATDARSARDPFSPHLLLQLTRIVKKHMRTVSQSRLSIRCLNSGCQRIAVRKPTAILFTNVYP